MKEDLVDVVTNTAKNKKYNTDGAVNTIVDALNNQQASIDTQINGVLGGSPANVVAFDEPRASIDELYSMVAGGKDADSQKTHIMGPRIDSLETPDEGTRYGAYRDDAMSPATQNKNNALITNNPNDIYIGGRVPKGTKVNAVYPGETDTFFLKQKFNPVKPYPLTFPNGRTMEVDTANLNKAAWLYYGAMEPTKEIDWFGYYKIPKVVEEGGAHAFARGFVNMIPSMVVRSATAVNVYAADIANGISTMLGNDVASNYYKASAKIARKVGNDLLNDVTWQYGPKGVGDAYANKFWNIGGQMAFMIPLAFASGMAGMSTVSKFEALDSALYVREAMEDKGRSTLKSALMGAGTGAGVYLLGMSPKWGDTAVAALSKPTQGLIKLAKESPAVLKKMYRARNILTAILEGVSEPAQDIFTSVMAGESPDWEAGLYTLFWSALASGVTLAVDRADPAKALLENVSRFKQFLDDHQEFLDMIVKGSNGAITKENLDLIFDMLADPKQTTDLLNYLKEGMIANFDKLTDEQKQQLVEKVKNLNPESDLDNEFRKLDERIDKIFEESDASGKTKLTEDQKALARLLLRGVAAQQLANFNVLPSEMVLPKGLFGGYETTRANVEGSTTKSGVITVNNNIQSAYTPVGTVTPAATGSNSNLNTSALVRNEYAEAGVRSEQSGGFAGLSHEFWHWIEQQTGLTGVGEFMQGIKDLAEEIVPGITAGKKGVELSEAYAYAIGFAGEKVKSALGLSGKVADYIDFMNLAINAEDIAKGVEAGLRGYMQSFREVLKNNKALVDDLFKGYGTDQLHGAINSFIETGNPGALTLDDMRALNAVLSSAVDAETGDKLGQVFDSPGKAESFMKRYADEYDRLLEKDRGVAKITAEQLNQQRQAANKAVGVSKELTPSSSKDEGFGDKAIQIVSQDTPAQTTEEKETEEEPQPRLKKNGQPYDIDSVVAGRFDGDPDSMVGYLQNAARWSRESGMKFVDIKNRTVSYSVDKNGVPSIKLSPSFNSTQLDHYAAYVLLARNKLSEMYKKGILTQEHLDKIQDAELFSAAAEVQEANVELVLDRLSEAVSNGTANEEQQALYTTIAQYNNDMANMYIDFGPYTPVDTAKVALATTERLLEDLSIMSQTFEDKDVLTIINSKKFGVGIGQLSFNDWIAKYKGGEQVFVNILPEQVAIGAEVGGRNVNRSLVDILSDYVDSLERFIDYKTFPYDRVYDKPQKMSKSERRAIGVLRSKKTSDAQKARAKDLLGSIAENAEPLAVYFTPNYNKDFSSEFIDTETVEAAEGVKENAVNEADVLAASNVVREQTKKSKYLNPARGYLKRDIFDTPTPLEEIGMTMEEAEKQIRAGGVAPFDFRTGELAEKAREAINTNTIRTRMNNADARIVNSTRHAILAKLLQMVPSIGEATDKTARLNMLYAISSAKEMANTLFQEYVDAEDSFNINPTLNLNAFESGKKFSTTDRYQERLKEHMDKGYVEQTPASNLHVSDEVAFAYGNNIMRGVVSFKHKTPSGATGFIILQDVDTAEWRAKDLASLTKFPQQVVVSAQVLDEYGFLRKPIGKADPNRLLDLLALHDEISQAKQESTEEVGSKPLKDIPGYHNYTRIAENSIAETIEDLAQRVAAHSVVEEEMVEGAEEIDENPNELFAAAGEVPEIDPGTFAQLGAPAESLTDEDFKNLFGESSLEMYENLENGTLTPEQQIAWHERVTNNEENLKPRFSDFAKGIIKGVKMLRQGLGERKFGVLGKVSLMGAWQTGLDRKLRAIFGETGEKLFNYTLLSSKAQDLSEGRRHAFDKALMESAFNGSRKAYENWVVKTPTEQFDAKLSNGQTVKVTKGEIISMYMAKYVVDNKLVDTFNYTDPEARMRMFYQNFDELLDHLSETDERVGEAAVMAIGDARGTEGFLAQYWIPSVLASDYAKKGWQARNMSTPDNSNAIMMASEPLAATSAFESTLSIIGSRSLQESGLLKRMQALKTALVAEDIDLSKFKEMSPEDQMLYEELVRESAALKNELEQKIGSTMTGWLIDNIDVDLKFNPLVKDMTKNPVLGAFAKATRNVASSLLMLNLKQGFVNLGNYDMFNGLSNSSTLKFYTLDRINAWSHFKDAWNLMLTFPEWKRRLEQSGLTEQMRRVADMNEESFLKDIQQALYKNQKDGAANLVGAINTLGKLSAKYGLATNVVPDLVGIALGTYAVWNDVLARNGNNIQKAQNEIVTHVLNRVSSSNYMTRSAATKILDKSGLGAFEMFKGDQLQKIGTLSEAVLTLINTEDKAARTKAWKDITAVSYEVLRYIAIQAGWITAMCKLISGDDLSEAEKEYIYEATVREALTQIADTTQLGTFITPIVTGILEGRDMGVTSLPTAGIQRAATAARKGKPIKAMAELGAFIGATPIAPGTVRLLDGLFRMASEDEREAAVGRQMVLGRSETTAQRMGGFVRSPKTGKLKDKKVKKDNK